jgi:hypothetical protein
MDPLPKHFIGPRQQGVMNPGDERDVRGGCCNRVIGSVRRTLGGFFRAHSYMIGMGVGPIMYEHEAEAWVLENSESVVNYSRPCRCALDKVRRR